MGQEETSVPTYINMNIEYINKAIQDLENSDTTVANVQELACLYIVKGGISKLAAPMVFGLEKEVQDILPYYRHYCDIKGKYQRHEITEDAVIVAIQNVCKELSDLIDMIYSNTDMNKERVQIRNMIDSLKSKYS